MTNSIFHNGSMGAVLTSGFYNTFKSQPGSNFYLRASSIQSIWSGVVGIPLNGTLQIYGTNSPKKSNSLITTITVNSASNVANSSFYSLTGFPEYLQVIYTPNAITQGLLNMIINYEAIRL